MCVSSWGMISNDDREWRVKYIKWFFNIKTKAAVSFKGNPVETIGTHDSWNRNDWKNGEKSRKCHLCDESTLMSPETVTNVNLTSSKRKQEKCVIVIDWQDKQGSGLDMPKRSVLLRNCPSFLERCTRLSFRMMYKGFLVCSLITHLEKAFIIRNPKRSKISFSAWISSKRSNFKMIVILFSRELFRIHDWNSRDFGSWKSEVWEI